MAKTILQTKEEIEVIEQELNDMFTNRIAKFEKEFGVTLQIDFSNDVRNRPFTVKFVGSSERYGK